MASKEKMKSKEVSERIARFKKRFTILKKSLMTSKIRSGNMFGIMTGTNQVKKKSVQEKIMKKPNRNTKDLREETGIRMTGRKHGKKHSRIC